ncbi:MAG TPA: hypothetical protein VMW11_08135 [Candidatus Dormibacteraeota bacterium]|nr:hypothetical protein [Candidatus Dormibacteraeota bacterium]
MGRKPETDKGMVKLSEAAKLLGYHVETLRLRIRRGQLAALRGPHGTYYVSREAVAALSPPRRSDRRSYPLEALDWTWTVLEVMTDDEGASRYELSLIAQVKRDPALNPFLHRLLTVKRLRIAGLSSVEISDMIGISARQVRRLSAQQTVTVLDRLQDATERTPPAVLLERYRRRARKVVAQIQRRLEVAGFRYHRRPPQPGDYFVPRGRPAPAHKADKLFPEEIRRLKDGGLNAQQIAAIQLVGIGQDELNELILNGLPPKPA